MISCFKGESSFVDRDVVREFWTINDRVPDGTWALGWDTPSPEGSSAGKYFSKNAVGHLGYTGCSLWIEPEKEISVTLLTNRLHIEDSKEKVKEFRPLIHDLVMETLGED